MGTAAFLGIENETSIEVKDGKMERNFGIWSQTKTLTVPSGVHTIGRDAFCNYNSLSYVRLPKTLTYIDDNAFKNCGRLSSLRLPDALTAIGKSAFECSGLPSLKLPKSLTDIGDYAFSDCVSLTSVKFPKSLTCIGWRSFSGCSGIRAIKLPYGVTSIGCAAFEDCRHMFSVILPNSLNDIGEFAFSGCWALRSVVFRGGRMSGRTPVFIAWAVGSSRNRTNWQLTTLQNSRNILRLITELSFEPMHMECRRSVDGLDPGGRKQVFNGCDFKDIFLAKKRRRYR